MKKWLALFEEPIKLRGFGKKNPNSPVQRFLQSVDDATVSHPLDNRARLHGMVSLTLYPSINDRDNRVRISDIQSLEPRTGHATDTMNELCGEADNLGVDLELTAKAYGSGKMTTAQLVKWYEKFGFKVDGRYGSDAEGFDMIRPHQK